VRALERITKRTELLEPEKVKEYLANADVSENWKNKLCDDFKILPVHECPIWADKAPQD